MKFNRYAFAVCIIASTLFSHTAHAQCQAGFNTTISNLDVQFTNQASGAYDWIGYDYGDGGFDQNIASPSHTYAQAGIYVACQYIQDTVSFQCFDFTCDTLYLGGATCMADFYYSSNGLDAEFYSASIGQYDSMLWSFGDGNTSTDSMPAHTYASGGSYTVCLSLISNSTVCDSVCYSIYVDSAGGNCDADFTHNANGLNVGFSDQSTGNYNATFWDFGDGFGTAENTSNPSYTYFTAGTYEVCLIIYDTLFGSCYDEYCEEIEVTTGGGGGDCQASFTYAADELDLACTNTSTGTYITQLWSYGDGSTPSLSNTHTYSAPGTYEVCLTIGNLFPFCTDTYCEEVTINEFTCEPDFTYSFDENNLYQFTNTTTVGNVTSVLWDFGDGNTSTFNNPQYTYNLPGNYDVCLTTFDEDNNCGQVCKPLSVYPLVIGEPDTWNGLLMYPNPTSGQLHLNFAHRDNEEVHIQVIDISGRVVMDRESSLKGGDITLMLDVPAGAYYVKANLESGEHYMKPFMMQ